MKDRDRPEWDLASVAYDALAPRYDRVPEENRINRHMRRISTAKLSEVFRAGMRVLELGCGTGDEALALAASGVRVVALDPSKEMVRLARAKAVDRGLAGRTSFLSAAARDLPRLSEHLEGPFDGGYASFSLAYEPDLRPIAAVLGSVLGDRAPFLVSVPSRVCLVEFALAFALLRPSLAGKRLRPWHGHKVGTYRVPIRTYTPRGLARAVAPHLVLHRVEALPAIVPPPYMNRWYARLNGLADALERLDTVTRTRTLLRSFGDHLLAELRPTS